MDELILRGTIALGVAAYGVAEWRRLRRGPDGPARAWWTAALACTLAHAAAAFHWRHGWSHAAAHADTARQLGAAIGWAWGGGLYVNYAFYLVWIADAAWWWVAPARYARRPPWVTTAVSGFILFVVLNGAVVFARGPVRLIGAAVVLLVLVAWYSRGRQSLRPLNP
jgi:hypothetical protein